MALLEIQGKSFQINPIVLQTVRPFKIDTISLAAVADEEEININDRMAINGILKKKINEMIVEAKKEYLERVGEEGNASAPMLPLIRLKVYIRFCTPLLSNNHYDRSIQLESLI